MDHLGGLAKAMPRTALCFAFGAVAICGLPPLNGFVSELLIYLGAFRSLGIGQAASCPFVAFVAPALALIGALAVACFVKAFGMVFLGQPRSPHALHAHESGQSMTGPMLGLVAGCVFIGTMPLAVAPVLDQAVRAWLPDPAGSLPELATLAPLGWVSVSALALLALLTLAGMWLHRRIASGGATTGVTWDCGYAAPTPRMQYTASSFAQMLGSLFAWVQLPRLHLPPGELPLFPGRTAFRSHALDLVLDVVLKPAYRFGARITSSFRFLQAGNIHAYLFYIVLFLIVLLLWR
jgi:hydrogenase-4 component B